MLSAILKSRTRSGLSFAPVGVASEVHAHTATCKDARWCECVPRRCALPPARCCYFRSSIKTEISNFVSNRTPINPSQPFSISITSERVG
uniref:Putative secreted protein n=1 Tax=Anopheles marajoara TaxID=58244 RepID=A0A2M4C9Z4_9DIPT